MLQEKTVRMSKRMTVFKDMILLQYPKEAFYAQ